MEISTIVLYFVASILLGASFIKDKTKTKKALKKGWMAFLNLLPVLIPLFLLVGIVLSVITPQMIEKVMGDDTGILGVLLGMLVGSVAFMPPFITYPLGAELLQEGAGYPQVAAFMTTLMGVGLVYWAAETKYFGKKATLYRNALAFLAAGVVAIVVWRIL